MLALTTSAVGPFLLKGVDRELPAGDYRVVTDEELIEGLLSLSKESSDIGAYRRRNWLRDGLTTSNRSSLATIRP